MFRIPAFSLATFLLAAAAQAETIPTAIRPPSSASFLASFRATGVQIYGCDALTKVWVLEAPEAVLSDDEATHRIRHFAGPSWQAEDGSKVVGKLVAEAPAPVPDAIPWLLVATTSSGPGFFADVRFVQRYWTKSGVAPSGSCNSGEEARSPTTRTTAFIADAL